ncbi:MAG: recombinase XerC, partial [Mycobacteriaceae bacterium]|nr:recombinase XerC [Mycobacteriaceae bacterium]
MLEAYAEHLALERGRSEHTRRAYLTDLRGLFAFLDERAP